MCAPWRPILSGLQETKAAKEETLLALERCCRNIKYMQTHQKHGRDIQALRSFLKLEPLDVVYDMGIDEHDQEGRVIAAEFPTFFFVTVYTPNSGEGLARLDYRTTWNDAFREYMLWLNRRKPVIMCGDFNVAHQPIDLAHPKPNYNKSAGYTQQEIDGFDKLLNEGFIDTFRHFYPEEVKYSYWNFVTNGRAKNVGWRIDHFLVPDKILPNVKDAMIYDEYHGSDHCPVGLKINLN
jgi:exodeoxyribonuclease-3